MRVLPGRFLKELREKLELGLREVQEASVRIAEAEKNHEFYISAARLAQIENENSVPSVFKVFSLSAIYGVDFLEVLRRFGLDPGRANYYRSLLRLDVTHPVAAEVHAKDATVTLPVRLDPSFRWETTQLVSRVVEVWGEIPVAFLLQLNPRAHMYGYIGLRDFAMYPLLRPGSLVMIDEKRRRVLRDGWRTEFERPIYFVELRDGYRCAWCHLEGSCLTLIPHPMSALPAERFNVPQEAEVVGQVVGVAMRLVPPETRSPGSTARFPAPSAPEK
ncbi:MAG: helix-turn-helix domain-containing protein [Dehalococcoidia bacterium]